MGFWLWTLVGILILIIIFLVVKIITLGTAAREIRTAFADRLTSDTNTLIDLSCRDRNMRQLADEINTQLRLLRRERHRFWQGDSELKEAITNISHDLRTPLTAICGYLDLLEREETSETVRRYLKIIANRTDVLKQLTEELFRYSIVVSTLEDNTEETLILNHVLEESISAYYATLKSRGIRPHITLPEQKLTRILNKNALSRILGNVLSNALKYSDGDLIITLTNNGEMIIANHASHLDDIQVGKLFDRFYTVENARKSTGLGLSIAKILTEQMGGTITANYHDDVLSIHILFP